MPDSPPAPDLPQRPEQPDSYRSIELTRIGVGRYKATNARGGETFLGSGGEDPDFTPVEALLAAIAGCGALDVDAITGKRAAPSVFEVTAGGHKVRDEDGNHLVDLRLTFRVEFPEGDDGDRAREAMPRALAQTRDRLCTVSRTVALGSPVSFDEA
jgi:putative redox protein